MLRFIHATDFHLERAIAAALHMGFMEIMGYTPAATGMSRIL